MGLLDSPPTDGLWGTFLLAGGSEMRQWCVGGHAPSRIGAWVWPGRSSGSLSGSLRLSYHCSMSSDLLWKMLLVLWPLAFSTGHWIHPPLSARVTQAAVVSASGGRGSLLITFSPFRWLTGLVAIIEPQAHGLAWLAFRLVWLNLSGRLFLMRTGIG